MKKSDSHRPTTLLKIKKETLTQVFSCELCEIFEKTFFTEQCFRRGGRDVSSFNSIPRSIMIFKAEYSSMDQIKFAVERPQKPYKICSRETSKTI